ncbi:hypothetical protein ACJRO7_008150 [Eucalyptus globulus]|uniref:ABC transporter domain-containing protein n=1 Tax=Eucalyptus globulus TaxID=34317 RepID=A0ABD3IQP5_EUCGL
MSVLALLLGVENFSAVASVGPAFLLAVAMFTFVLQISSLITEKELKPRQRDLFLAHVGDRGVDAPPSLLPAHRCFGCHIYDTAYWLSWLTWEGIINILSSLSIVLFAMMIQFNFFWNNSFPVVFLLFFLFQLNMIGFALMLSAFISKASSSTTVGFSIFIIGFLTQLVMVNGFPYGQGYGNGYRTIWSLFPPNLLAEAVKLLSQATSTHDDPGISWSRHEKCAPNNTEGVISIVCSISEVQIMTSIYGLWQLSVWFIFAIYFDNIIPNASGGGICSCIGSIPRLEHVTPDDKDVLQEERIVKAQAKEGSVDPNVAVQIRGLGKTYPGTIQLGCCKSKRTSRYHAFKELWVNFAKDQLFCLLGHNGAGKTTTINCLTGITPVTGGDALVCGCSIRNSVGMSNIRKIIGVCPQFDILQDLLTGEEHLYLFINVEGLSPASIKSVHFPNFLYVIGTCESASNPTLRYNFSRLSILMNPFEFSAHAIEKSLEEVRLTEAGKVRTGSYSRGMKCRLSVAIALIGDPKLVVLDELQQAWVHVQGGMSGT